MAQEVSNRFRHVLPIQIRFNDVDKFGHVNNTVYFQFYDTAKTDYIATVCKGVDWEQVAIVVVRIEADFVSQIKAGDHIAARTRVIKVGNKSFHLEQEIIDADTQEVKCRCFSVMVFYDLIQHPRLRSGGQLGNGRTSHNNCHLVIIFDCKDKAYCPFFQISGTKNTEI